jgi:quinol monooxygenase YgiN
MSIVELATMRAKPGHADDMAKALPAALAVIAAAEGCLEARALRCVERPDEFVVRNRWVSVVAHEAFRDAPEFSKYRATFIRYLCQELGLRSDRERFDEVWQVVSEAWNWPRITEHEWQEGSAAPSNAAPVQINIGNAAEISDTALRGNEAIVREPPSVPKLPPVRGIPGQRYGARLGILIVLGGMLAMLITLLRSVLSPSPVESKVLITEPKDGDTVERQIAVKGTFENLPEDMSIWVLIITNVASLRRRF